MSAFSVYADAYFLIGYALAGFLALFAFIAAAFAFVPAIARKRAPTLIQTRVSGVLLWFCGLFASAALAVLSAFDYAELWYVILASVVTWLCLCVPITLLWSPSLPQPFFSRPRRRISDVSHRSPHQTPKSDSDEELRQLPSPGAAGPMAGAVLPPPSAELRQRNQSTTPPSNSSLTHHHQAAAARGTPPFQGTSAASRLAAMDGGTIRFSKELIEELSPQIAMIKTDLRTRWPHYLLVLVLGLGVSATLIVVTYGACICSQPTSLTSWATRHSKSKICSENSICHTYTLLGKDCTELVAVSHVVLEPGVSVVSSELHYICSDAGSPSSSRCTDGLRNVSGTVLNVLTTFSMDDIEEDVRFVLAMPFSVVGGNMYNISFQVLLSNGRTLSNSGIPLRVKSPTCQTANTDVGYVWMGGGDYRVAGDGEAIVGQGMQRSPEAQFYYIAGDLAYANNMRRCYLRWDLFFQETVRVLTKDSDGTTLPILAAPGNHEGGGYLQASSRAEREQRIVFFTRYFPHYLSSLTPVAENNVTFSPANPDWTLTFHSHAVGTTLGIIVLDSDIIVAASSQTKFMATAASDLLLYLDPQSTAQNVSLQQSRRLVYIYHNPAYPSTRDSDNAVSSSIIRNFVPTMEMVNNWTSLHGVRPPTSQPLMHPVACVLEHHDHAYKRTVPISRGAATTVEAGGLVYLGDGALGVSPRAGSDTTLWYLDKAQQINYVLRLASFYNGTFAVTAYQPDGSFLDALRT
ncbi:transmembrane protein, putative [Bodo saltans]|uniref:Transmembrane protein, putative n=1 Tax=Bodo saltans TaxID=75058 RepID=A0A0S4KHL4_BODSA|nr:transmembrane protein, putative [Bodo saltans]|eukprot:CUI14092.1 transmembrane protein, putative [Bodo saltans]